MRLIFCHTLKIEDFEGVEAEKNMVVGLDSSNMGTFATIRWTKRFSRKIF